MYEIIPGILEKDWAEIERKINIIKQFAPAPSDVDLAAFDAVKYIHIDIIDGKFAPNAAFLDPAPFSQYSREMVFEVHMMVEEPINYLKPFASAGFKRFIGHVEKMSDQVEFVARGQLLGEVGLAIDSQTSVDEIKVPLADLDFVTVMTVKAGLSGQEFIAEHLKKVKVLKQKSDIKIEIDGGVNDNTIVAAMKAGANRFVATSFLFAGQDPQKQYNLLKSCLRQ